MPAACHLLRRKRELALETEEDCLWSPALLSRPCALPPAAAAAAQRVGALARAAAMAPRVTAYDVAQAGSMTQLIGQTIEQLRYGKMEDKEFAAQLLRSLTEMKSVVEAEKVDESKPIQDDDRGLSLGKPGESFSAFMDNIGHIVLQQGIKPLVSVLSGGSSAVQRDAAGALANIASGRRDNQEKIIAAGGIKPLATILRTGDASTMEQAAAALASISQNLANQQKIISAGAIGPLVALLKGNMRHDAQIYAAQALANLATENKDGQIAIAKARAIPQLLDLLAAGKAQEATSRALGQLALDNLENQKEICKLGGISKLLQPLSGVNTEAQVQAAGAIAALAGGERNKSRQNAIAKAGGLRPILALVTSRYDSAKMMGLHAVAQMSLNNRANQDEIARLEGLPPLALLVSSGSAPPEVHMYAARALAELVRHNHANQTTIADLGVISLLVSLLRSTSTSAVEAEVAGALGALAQGHVANQGAVASAGAVSVLVGLLGSRSDAAANNAGNALSAIGLDNMESQKEIAKLLVGLLTTAKRESTQERAAGALWRLVRQNPSDQFSIAQAGGAQPLVRLLREGSPGGRTYALWSLSLCINETNQATVVESGAIEPLVDALMSEDMTVTQQAAGALSKLATVDTVDRIACAGAISPLITLLDGKDSSAPALQHAAGALAAVALVPAQRVSIDRAGGIPPLVALLVDPMAAAMTKRHSAAALALLSNEEEDMALALAAEAAEEEQRQKAELLLQWELAQAAEQAVRAPGAAAPASAPAPASSAKEGDNEAATAVIAEAAAPAAEVSKPSDATPATPQKQKLRETQADVKQSDKGKVIDRSPRKRAIWNEGAIAPLVALLALNCEAQEEAAGALRALAEDARIRDAITHSGGIGPLVALLGGSNPDARDNAEGALVRLSTEMANRVLIIEQLVGMLYNPDIAAREQAAAAIANLAHESTANCSSIVDAGGIPPLLALLESDSAKAKENSASAMTQLARGSRPNQNAITKAGGIPLLVSVLTSSSTNKGDVKQEQLDAIITHAMRAVWMLAKKNFANQVALAEAGVITPLVSMLANASPELQLPATGVIECLLQSKDIQASIVRTGAIAPLCMLSRDGVLETQEQAASALWSLALERPLDPSTKSNAMANRTTIAKLGGIESLVKMFHTGGSEKSQKNAAGALAAIACKHQDNRYNVAKRLIGQLNAKTNPEAAARTMAAVTRMCERKPNSDQTLQEALDMLNDEEAANQTALAKGGALPAIIGWLEHDVTQPDAAHALLAMAANNPQTQAMIAKAQGIEGLISVIKTGKLEAQEHASLALWHLASTPESQQAVADADGVPALVSMLAQVADANQSSRAAELAAVTIVRLAQGNPTVSMSVAEVGGIIPLVKLLGARAGTAQQAAAALAELGLVAKNRDAIANSGGIDPLIKLLNSTTVGTPETAARALAHIARSDGEADIERASGSDDNMCGAEERRAHIHYLGGVQRLVSMLDGSNLTRKGVSDKRPGLKGAELWTRAATKMDETVQMRSNLSGVGASGLQSVGIQVGMQEQAAAALAELANGDPDMQDAIIEACGVTRLLALVHEGKQGTQIAQEHAARAIGHLSTSVENQKVIVSEGCIPELVLLVRNGNPQAQEVGAFALANIARGAGRVDTRQHAKKPVNKTQRVEGRRRSIDTVDPMMVELLQQPSSGGAPISPRKFTMRIKPTGSMYKSLSVKVQLELSTNREALPNADELDELTESDEEVEEVQDGITEIANENGIPALVDLMSNRNALPLAKEHAAAAVYHLAIDPQSRELVAQHNGIAPLVALLSDGTHQAQLHASDALARLANQGRDHQSQIAKKLIGLLMSHNTTMVQKRAAHALRMLAVDNPASPVAIVNAGAISPLVHLLSTTPNDELKKEAEDALLTIVAGADDNAAAVTDLVVLLGTGSLKAQELVAQLLLTLCNTVENRRCISKSGALQKLVLQLTSQSLKVQELAAAVLSYLSGDSPENVAAIAKAGGVNRMVALLDSPNSDAQAYAAAVIADLTNDGQKTVSAVVNAKAISPLVNILAQSANSDAKAEAAGALGRIAKAGTGDALQVVVEMGAIKPLVELLEDKGRRAQRKAASALAALVSGNASIQKQIMASGGVPLLVHLLYDGTRQEVQAHAAAAIAELASGNFNIQTAIAEAGCIRLLVAMLQETTIEVAMEAAAAAICNLTAGHARNQIAVAAHGGILALIARLASAGTSVQLEATQALSHLASACPDNVPTIANLIVKLLSESSGSEYSERAARAITALAQGAPSMRDAIAQAGGLRRLVLLLQSTLDGTMVVDVHEASMPNYLASGSRRPPPQRSPSPSPSSASPSQRISSPFARLSSSPVMRRSSRVGGDRSTPSPIGDPQERVTTALQLELASAIRALAQEHSSNQAAFAELGGIPLLIALVDKGALPPAPKAPSFKTPEPEPRSNFIRRSSIVNPSTLGSSSPVRDGMPGSPPINLASTGARQKRHSITSEGGEEVATSLMAFAPDDRVQREAAGALMNLVALDANRKLVASSHGIDPLIALLKTGTAGAQETAAGALNVMAESPVVCESISHADAISALSSVLDKGNACAKDQAAGLLTRLAFVKPPNQLKIASQLVAILSNPKADELERASQLAHDLAEHRDACAALADAGVIPLLVKQIEAGTEHSGDFAARTLGYLADVNAERRGEITHQLIHARHHATDLKRGRRAGKALDDMNASAFDGIGDDTEAQEAVGMAILLFRLHTRD